MPNFCGCPAALDSAGFVAMVRYRGYPWSIAEYVSLAKALPWDWWASMDFCCEREVAADRQEVVSRVARTVIWLDKCLTEAERQGVKPPMPVLQGWQAADYVSCAAQMEHYDHYLPDLVGVGSVCRRALGGPDGLLAIISRLDRELPRNVRLHLFGVKGSAIRELADHPRIWSVDSMAWDAAARREKNGRSCSVEYRIGHLRRWFNTNRGLLTASPQMRLAV